MGRHWTQYEFLNSENLWMFIDEQSSRMALQMEDKDNSELYRLFVAGKREMLDALSTYLMENEATLRQIVEDCGVMTAEEIQASLDEEYGLS